MATTIEAVTAYGQIRVEVDLPALTGTPNPVAYATDIRPSIIRAALEQLIANPAAVAKLNAAQADRDALLAAIAQVVAEKTDAQDWLDNRTFSPWLIRLASARVLEARKS